jgi:biopolymer transport protein ExbD
MGEEAQAMHTTESTRRERTRRRMQQPLTSMIDVTFLLLVFFLLTFTFREQEGQIRAGLPKQGSLAGIPGMIVRVPVLVHSAGPAGRDAIYEMEGVESVISSPQELYAMLRARRQALSADGVVVVIKPTRHVRWQHVVEAFNQAVRAKFESVSLARCS